MAHPAEDLDRTHDPGPDEANDRAAAVEEAAVEPIPWTGDHAVRVGTASWTDPTMTAPGVFYPRAADTAEERLQFYASRFPVVEVDATYYALPNERTSQLWVERTPPDFVFDIKAHALMTGQPTETKRLPKDIREALPAELAAKSAALQPRPARGVAGRGLQALPRGHRAASRRRSAGGDLPPVPALVLPGRRRAVTRSSRR